MYKVITIIIIFSLPTIALTDTLLFEDFENGGVLPPGWTINTPDPTNWVFTTNSTRYFTGGITTGSTDYAAVADSDLDKGTMDTWLTTPSINCANYTNIILNYYNY